MDTVLQLPTYSLQSRSVSVATKHLKAKQRLAPPPSLQPNPAYQVWDPEDFDYRTLDAPKLPPRLPRKRLARLSAKGELEPVPVRRARSARIAISLTEGIDWNCARSSRAVTSPPVFRLAMSPHGFRSATSAAVFRASGAGKIFRHDREAKVLAFAEALPRSLPRPAFASGVLRGAPLRSARACPLCSGASRLCLGHEQLDG